jgi:hypothetical protein
MCLYFPLIFMATKHVSSHEALISARTSSPLMVRELLINRNSRPFKVYNPSHFLIELLTDIEIDLFRFINHQEYAELFVKSHNRGNNKDVAPVIIGKDNLIRANKLLWMKG